MDKDTIRTILCYIRKHTFLVVLSLVLAAVTVVSTLYLPILTGHAIDCMIAKGKVDFAALRPILEKMIVTLAITGFSQWLMNVCNNRITYLVMREIREDAFHHIHDLPLKYLDGHPSGDIVSRVIADVDQLRMVCCLALRRHLPECLRYLAHCYLCCAKIYGSR